MFFLTDVYDGYIMYTFLDYFKVTLFSDDYMFSPTFPRPAGDFGIEDREILREEAPFDETAFIHGSSASNLLLEAEPGPAHIPDKSANLEYDDFGDNNLENSDGGILGKDGRRRRCRYPNTF